MKQLKLFFALLAMLALGVGNAWGANCDYSDDFSTVKVNTSYSTRTTTAGWNATYTAVEDYTYNSKSYRAFKMNGKKGGLGKITSPLFSDGCSAISFVYGQAHKDAIKFDVKIYDKNNVELFSKSYSASKPSAAPTAGVLVEETITGVEGDFYVVFANTSTSTSTSNGYRVSIMNVCITSAGSGSTETVVSLIPKNELF